jgi:hypothetical protein
VERLPMAVPATVNPLSRSEPWIEQSYQVQTTNTTNVTRDTYSTEYLDAMASLMSRSFARLKIYRGLHVINKPDSI